MKTIKKLKKMIGNSKLVTLGITMFLGASLFTACDLNDDDTKYTNQTPNASILETIDPQPISPEGKAIISLGEENGDVSSILTSGNLKIKSIGAGKEKFSAYKNEPKNFGTLIINVTDEDLLNLAELEKTYKSALDKNITVYFESSKSNRRALNEVFVKFFGGTGIEKGLFAVQIQKFTDGSIAVTPFCSSFNQNLKANLGIVYSVPYIESLGNEETVPLKSNNGSVKSSISKTACNTYFTNMEPVDAGKDWFRNCSSDERLGDVYYSQEFKDGTYTVIDAGTKKDYVIKASTRAKLPANTPKGTQIVSLSKSDSVTKTWSVQFPNVQGKWKVADLLKKIDEIALSAAGSYGESTTTGWSDTFSAQCLYTENWVERYCTTREIYKAQLKGNVGFNVNTYYLDFNDFSRKRINKITVNLDGASFATTQWTGKKPLVSSQFWRYKYKGTKLK